MELKVKGLYQKRGWFYFSRMRQGIRTVVALETQNLEDAMTKARKLQEQPGLLAPEEARLEVKGFIEYKLKHNEYSRFSAENKSLTLYRFVKGQGTRKLDQITTAHVQKFYESEIERVTESTAQGYILTIRSFFNYLVGERKVLRSNLHLNHFRQPVRWHSSGRPQIRAGHQFRPDF